MAAAAAESLVEAVEVGASAMGAVGDGTAVPAMVCFAGPEHMV